MVGKEDDLMILKKSVMGNTDKMCDLAVTLQSH